MHTVLIDETTPPIFNASTELVQRLQVDECEICGSRDGMQVHHISTKTC